MARKKKKKKEARAQRAWTGTTLRTTEGGPRHSMHEWHRAMARYDPTPLTRAKAGAASRPSSAETVANPKDPRFRSRAGTKPDYNWEAAITEAGRYMFENGVPTKLEELLEHVAKWFGESEPSHSQLTQKIGPVYRAFKSVSSGR